ncbi:hypothetical protein PPYR_05994 [Photinus pyralis]|uniref:Uncharacterized protein n=1 Tax=Photinus pyralis TaxID=7054 RepID=A0A1Y1MVF5_PHOPY|nr:glutaredoxin-3-like [Photinus pyralis]XP_031338534.1 glutaredoxin-3-like [Photinus pyralis]KAB0800239.1 hypothetical protein PPYR_05979 [Photinus pyralis]KAB0800254.1 hypothetical protein PPYR_05994 [Photinus pyralis]
MPLLLTNGASFETALKNPLSVIHFAADWVEQCAQVNDLLDALSKEIDYSGVKFCTCPAEDIPEISLKYQIEAVPTILLFRNGQEIDRVNGADAAKITAKVKEHCRTESSVGKVNEKEPLEARLKQLINKHKVMLFMKGDRNAPRCGFSKQIIAILNDTGVSYDTFDILTDEDVRQGLKTYSDWPTYPQLYVTGELVGGLDIVKEMLAAGDLVSTLQG